jgi:hypothetical protein
MKYDFKAATQDRLQVWIADEVFDEVNRTVSEVAVDLSGKTVYLNYSLNGAATVEVEMTKLTQTGDDIGRAYYAWTADELEAGEMECEVWVIDSDTTPHGQPGKFTLSIDTKLRA